jgi:hypothetical protein
VLAAAPSSQPTAASAAPPPQPPPPAPVPAPAAAQPAPAQAEQPPAGPPPGPPAGRGEGRKFPLVPALIVAALVIAGIILAVVLLSGGSDKKSTTTTGGNETPTTLLAAVMPSGIAKQCNTDSKTVKGAVESETCAPPDNAPNSYPEQFTLAFYPNATARDTAYDAAKASIKIGSCGGTPGEKTWLHVSTGERGGRRVCGTDNKTGASVITWTHEKLGSPTHVDTVGIARSSIRGANLFSQWWNSVNDDIGKCRPKLGETSCFAVVKKFEQKKGAA